VTGSVRAEDWMRYALHRIRTLVDRPREQLSDDELSIFTFAQNALVGGDPVIRLLARGPGVRMCRLCLAEWNEKVPADHVHGCPLGASGAA
jgi:hypothetical protein